MNRVQFKLSERAEQLLDAATTTRKRGTFISKLIETFVDDDGRVQGSDGVIERIDRRLSTIEQQLREK